MGFKISEYETSKEKEVSGVWVDFAEGCRLLLARVGNPKYRACLNKRMRSARRLAGIRHGGDQSSLHEATAHAAARHVLLGWEGLEDKDGNAIEYNVERAEELLLKYPDFYDEVIALAADMELFRPEVDEALEGNLPGASGGPSNGTGTA